MLELLTEYGWNHADAPVLIQSFETECLRELNEKTDVTLVQLIDGYDNDPMTGKVVFRAPYDCLLANCTEKFIDLTSPAGLIEVATYADIISVWKRFLLQAVANQVDAAGNIIDSNGDGVISDADYTVSVAAGLIEKAHAVGLKVHTWTMRDEKYRLARTYGGNATLEYLDLFEMGIDGLFSDNCKVAVPARDAWLALQEI